MKKIYLLLVCMLAVSVSYAQMRNTRISSGMLSKTASKGMVNTKDLNIQKSAVQVNAVESDANVVATGFNSVQDAMLARQKAAAAAPFIQYLNPEGTLYHGYTRDYQSYQSVLFLYGPAKKTLDYIPYSDAGATISWTQGAQLLDSETDNDGVLHKAGEILPPGYVYYVPKATATAGGESASYQLGQGVAYQFMYSGNVQRKDPADDGTDLGATEEFPPLTLANMHANRPSSGNLFGSFSQMGGFSPSYTHAEYGPCTGIMQVLPRMVSPFYAESVSVLAYTSGGGNAMPAGGELKIQFYYLTEDGKFGELIAESTTNEFVKTYNQQGAFIFTFEEEEDGFVSQVPLILGTKAPVAVVLSGFDATWDFNVLFGTNGKLPGSSYTLHGNHVATFGFSDAPDFPRADLYIEFNGIFNCLYIDPECSKVEFPVEGGLGSYRFNEGMYFDVDVYSSINLTDKSDDFWYEVPDWVIGIGYDNSYFDDYNLLLFFFDAAPLPAGETGRNGEIVLGSYGATVTIQVKQGDAPWTGTPSVKPVSVTKAVRQGDSFQLTYPQGTTSVAVYSVTGQKVAEYKLNANGTASIPAGNWAKGVYVLKFEGKTNVTVKVIK